MHKGKMAVVTQGPYSDADVKLRYADWSPSTHYVRAARLVAATDAQQYDAVAGLFNKVGELVELPQWVGKPQH